jgi:hypothetical protein
MVVCHLETGMTFVESTMVLADHLKQYSDPMESFVVRSPKSAGEWLRLLSTVCDDDLNDSLSAPLSELSFDEVLVALGDL